MAPEQRFTNLFHLLPPFQKNNTQQPIGNLLPLSQQKVPQLSQGYYTPHWMAGQFSSEGEGEFPLQETKF